MTNRPTEPGSYWWKDTDGEDHVAEFDKHLECYTGYDGYDCLDVLHFMVLDVFCKWLGKAVPPNNCDTCQHGQSCDEMGPCDVCEPTGFTRWEPIGDENETSD